VHPDGFVAKRLVGLPIGGQKQPLGRPPLPPLPLGELGVLKLVARLGEPPATPAHRHSTLPEPALDPSQARLEVL